MSPCWPLPLLAESPCSWNNPADSNADDGDDDVVAGDDDSNNYGADRYDEWMIW